MNIITNKTYLAIISSILIWNIGLRIFFWPDQSITNILYYESLENRILEYIINTGIKPPIMYFFQGLIFKAFSSEFVLT